MKLFKTVVVIIIITCFLFLIHSAIYQLNTNIINKNKQLIEENLKLKEEINKQKQEQFEIEKVYKKIISLNVYKDATNKEIIELSKAIYYYSRNDNIISENLLISIANKESKFHKYAEYKGCVGYYQIHTGYHKLESKFDAFQQTAMAIKIYKQFYKIYNGNQLLALNGYNGNGSYTNSYGASVISTMKKLNSMG